MDKATFGRIIKEKRVSLSLTQKEFGDRFEVSQQAVGLWERGESLPQGKTQLQVCSLLGIDPMDIEDMRNAPKVAVVQTGNGNVSNSVNGSGSITTGGSDLRPDVLELAHLIQDAWSPREIRSKIEELKH